MGCKDFASFLEEEESRRGGHFGSSPLMHTDKVDRTGLDWTECALCQICAQQAAEQGQQ